AYHLRGNFPAKPQIPVYLHVPTLALRRCGGGRPKIPPSRGHRRANSRAIARLELFVPLAARIVSARWRVCSRPCARVHNTPEFPPRLVGGGNRRKAEQTTVGRLVLTLPLHLLCFASNRARPPLPAA